MPNADEELCLRVHRIRPLLRRTWATEPPPPPKCPKWWHRGRTATRRLTVQNLRLRARGEATARGSARPGQTRMRSHQRGRHDMPLMRITQVRAAVVRGGHRRAKGYISTTRRRRARSAVSRGDSARADGRRKERPTLLAILQVMPIENMAVVEPLQRSKAAKGGTTMNDKTTMEQSMLQFQGKGEAYIICGPSEPDGELAYQGNLHQLKAMYRHQGHPQGRGNRPTPTGTERAGTDKAKSKAP